MKRRILIVDDELAILLTLKAVLEMNGFEVETASSAREAEQKLRGSKFEMVITDMRMENETSGFAVIRSARAQSYNPATAILTAFPNLGSDWKTEGAESLLVKPMNTGDLLRQIEALLITHQDSKQDQDVKRKNGKQRSSGIAAPNGCSPVVAEKQTAGKESATKVG